MSILIQKNKCSGCGRCIEACPGNLIKRDTDGKVKMRHPRDCWGCTSCLKVCQTGAVLFFLGADLGGGGSTLSVKHKQEMVDWTVTRPDGTIQTIEVNQNDSNRY